MYLPFKETDETFQPSKVAIVILHSHQQRLRRTLVPCDLGNRSGSSCWFYLHFLNDSWGLSAFFVHFFGHLPIFFGELSVQTFCPSVTGSELTRCKLKKKCQQGKSRIVLSLGRPGFVERGDKHWNLRGVVRTADKFWQLHAFVQVYPCHLPNDFLTTSTDFLQLLRQSHPFDTSCWNFLGQEYITPTTLPGSLPSLWTDTKPPIKRA